MAEQSSFSVGLLVDECLASFNYFFFVTASFIVLDTTNNPFYALIVVGLAATIANGVRPNAHFNPARSIATLFHGANPLEALVVRPLGQFLGCFLSGWVIFLLWDQEKNFAANSVFVPVGGERISAFLLEAFVTCLLVYFLGDNDNNNDKGNFKIYGLVSLITFNNGCTGNWIRSAAAVFFQWTRLPDGATLETDDLWFLIGAGCAGAVIAAIFNKFIEAHIPSAEKEGSHAADQDNNAVPLSNQAHP